jgi:hypothetical protein
MVVFVIVDQIGHEGVSAISVNLWRVACDVFFMFLIKPHVVSSCKIVKVKLDWPLNDGKSTQVISVAIYNKFSNGSCTELVLFLSQHRGSESYWHCNAATILGSIPAGGIVKKIVKQSLDKYAYIIGCK